MNFVKKTAFLAISLLVGSQMIHGMHNAHDGDPVGGAGDVKASYFQRATALAKSGLNLAKGHYLVTGGLGLVAGSAALYKFNDAVRNRVNQTCATVKAKMSEGYTSVRSRVQPALDHSITFKDVIVTGLASGALALAYKGYDYVPQIRGSNGAYASVKKSLSGMTLPSWFAKENDNRVRNSVIALLGTAATATAGYFGVKAYKARKARLASTASASSTSAVVVEDDEDEELS